MELGKQQIYAGQAPELIKSNLEANAYSKEHSTFERPLSEEEIVMGKDEFVQKNIQLHKLKEDFKKINDEFKEKIRKIEEAAAKRLATLRTGTETVEGVLYALDDQEKKIMYFYDEKGNLVNQRRLLPSERQTSMLSMAANQ